MGRRWVPILIIVVGGVLGMAVAGFPSRGRDAPITVQAQASTTTSTSVVTASTTTTATTPPKQVRSPDAVRVMVFNASGIPGSATSLGSTIKSKGWSVKAPGADRKAQDDSVIMYRPDYESEAQALATALGLDLSVVAPLDAGVVKPDATDLGVIVGTGLAKRSG